MGSGACALPWPCWHDSLDELGLALGLLLPVGIGGRGHGFFHEIEQHGLGQHDVLGGLADRPALGRRFPFPLLVGDAVDGGEKLFVRFSQPVEDLGSFFGTHMGIGSDQRQAAGERQQGEPFHGDYQDTACLTPL